MTARKKKKTEAKPCTFCKCVEGIFLFREEDDIGLSCPECGAFGPRVRISLEIDEDGLWELAAKAWNTRKR